MLTCVHVTILGCLGTFDLPLEETCGSLKQREKLVPHIPLNQLHLYLSYDSDTRGGEEMADGETLGSLPCDLEGYILFELVCDVVVNVENSDRMLLYTI